MTSMIDLSDLADRTRDRVTLLRGELARIGASAAFVVAPANQTYLSGFRALLYSRPILLVVTPDATAFVVPGLEEVHARRSGAADEILAYVEHPSDGRAASYQECVDGLLRTLPAGGPVAIEYGSCSTGFAEHLSGAGHRLVDLDAHLIGMRAQKDAAEIAVIRDAAQVARSGVAASLAFCTPGTTEIEVDAAGTAAVMADVARFGESVTVEQLIMTPSGAERTTLPHVLSTTRPLVAGDGLIHTRQVGLHGYRAELERTAFVGPPSAEQRRVFAVVRDAQRRAIDAVRAGARCRDVDAAARQTIAAAGLDAYAIHRTGHGIGLSPHEWPYLTYDSDVVLDERMVITVEPGVYVPELGGFRHSDTLVVTGDGAEVITDHPSDIDHLTLSPSR
jgi:Xaa-Pro dipeptidase